MIIYKITNKVNGKVYIGLTTTTLKYRWTKHKAASRDLKNTKHLYKAMRKYGIENFSIEQIDETNDFTKLGDLERKYISEYNSTDPDKGYNLTAGGERNQYDGNSQAKLTIKDVVKIRQFYAECKLRMNECRLQYYPWMSEGGFQKVWVGESWHGICDDVYTEENKKWHKIKQKVNEAEKNGNALFTNDEVLEIRKYYVNHTLTETFNKFHKECQKSPKQGFRQVIDRTYKSLPIYSKVKKGWFLNDKPIDIEKYNPVSTISGSGE
jgi:group I intron endonuclease